MKYLIPEQLETERLLLRYWKEEDWKDLHAYYSDPECMKYTIQRTLSEGETWRTMVTMIGHWTLRDYGPYAVELKETGAVLGPVGMWFPNDWPECEIKWGLAQKYWGKGYASEAARAVHQMAKEHFPDQRLISQIFAENQGSINVAKAIGAVFEEEVMFRGLRCHIYRHS